MTVHSAKITSRFGADLVRDYDHILWYHEITLLFTTKLISVELRCFLGFPLRMVGFILFMLSKLVIEEITIIIIHYS